MTTGAPSLANWHLTVAYDGAAYRGWQLQPSPIPTVQGVVVDALGTLFFDPPQSLSGTSRTDTGVHALDQHVTFRAVPPGNLAPHRIAAILNRRLPGDVRILHSERREDEFHARHNALAKAYVYTIRRKRPCPPFDSRYVWNCDYDFDAAVMVAAAKELVGTHDFASFGVNPKREVDSTVCTLHRVDILENDPYVHMVIVGDRFLYKMVRSIVGFLVDVGVDIAAPRGGAEHSRAVLRARNRSVAAETAPPTGLFLAKVFYQPNEWRTYTPPLPPHVAPW
ncbi:MAG: tRNA pseudouridine(38-40) synthase TruA [Verrucomicrobiota bacterium]